jgi:hypothetical protein
MIQDCINVRHSFEKGKYCRQPEKEEIVTWFLNRLNQVRAGFSRGEGVRIEQAGRARGKYDFRHQPQRFGSGQSEGRVRSRGAAHGGFPRVRTDPSQKADRGFAPIHDLGRASRRIRFSIFGTTLFTT